MADKIRYGMVGGGKGADIGHVHRFASRLDNDYELVSGVFSRDRENSLKSGQAFGVEPSRIYNTYEEMFAEEAKLPADKRVQVITVVTPNNFHFPVSFAALQYGFHVICEKPLTFSVDEAKQLQQLIKAKDALFCINFTKAAFPMVRQMRAMVQQGQFGEIKKIMVDYRGCEFDAAHSDTKQAQWRIDPQQSGPTGTLGDIGSHAFHLTEFVTGLKATKLLAYMHSIMPNRPLDDDNTIILQYDNGASGVINASQALPAERENLTVSIYGEKGGIKWSMQNEDELILHWLDKPIQILRSGVDNAHLDEDALGFGRIPGGRNEGHISAVANYYREFAKAVRAKLVGDKDDRFNYPRIEEGIRNMNFLETALASAKQGNVWLALEA